MVPCNTIISKSCLNNVFIEIVSSRFLLLLPFICEYLNVVNNLHDLDTGRLFLFSNHIPHGSSMLLLFSPSNHILHVRLIVTSL